ncbi:signal recognition particle subunit srp14 [Diplogelasinospora grovesii]|uniref:Signal recognition particle subunit SRP14 n=1 Tax=Diplogelasinospora grovesii TaxID=303347 RepID=A0AAN6N9C7_9PEZI|nr:signal recognition particle subunit srp14 [Diplogelasinospora grovesii]
MGHLTHDEFFARLTELFNARKGKDYGHIYLTQKRFSYEQQTEAKPTAENPFPELHPEKPLPLIIRATNGKSTTQAHTTEKVKVSTIVQPADLEAFYSRYAEVCRAGMSALKPRDRTKRKAKARKKNKGGGGGAAQPS